MRRGQDLSWKAAIIAWIVCVPFLTAMVVAIIMLAVNFVSVSRVSSGISTNSARQQNRPDIAVDSGGRNHARNVGHCVFQSHHEDRWHIFESNVGRVVRG